MPILNPGYAAARLAGSAPEIKTTLKQDLSCGLLSVCANPRCTSGWIRIWRSRTTPVFEGGWCCSAECTLAQVASALKREIDMLGRSGESHGHRIPLGLLMLEQGWITAAQLRNALAAQRTAKVGRIGEWLQRGCGINEQMVTRALALQWRCPALPMESYDPESAAVFLPRLFVDAFSAIPIRTVGGKLLYLGFEERLDSVLALALERMVGVRVENGLVADSTFRPTHASLLRAKFPRVELIEAISERVLAREIARRVEKVRPVECRLARVHDFFWLRMWTCSHREPLPEVDAVVDLICTLQPHL